MKTKQKPSQKLINYIMKLIISLVISCVSVGFEGEALPA